MREAILESKTIAVDLGKQGENKATLVRFDIPEDWQEPTAAVTVRVTRPGETDAYVPEGLNFDGKTLIWEVNSADTAIDGIGRAQVCCVAGGRLIKTRAFVTHISPSVGVDNETVDPPTRSILSAYLEMISELAAGAENSMEQAESSKEDAAESAAAARGFKSVLDSKISIIEAEIKQMVLEAVAEAAEHGEIIDLDTGFVTTLKEINHGLPFRVWLGTTEEYQTLAEAGLLEAGVLYLRSDDTSAEEIRAAVAALQAVAAELQAKTADSGWKTLPIIYDPTEWTVGTPAPKYRKIGNHVYVKGQVRINLDQMYDPDTGSEDITTIFATLPEGYRPATSFYKLIPNQGDRMARLYVRSASASGDPGGMNINYLKDYSGTPIKSGTVWIQIDCDFLTD